MARTLTAKQATFVTHYVECGVGAEAVRLAGYETKQPQTIATQLLSKPHVAAKVAKLAKAADRAACVTREVIMAGLLDIAEHAEKDGDRVNAWKTILAMVPGATAPTRVEHAGKGGGAIRVVGLSPEAASEIRGQMLGIGTEAERPGSGEHVH